MRCLAVLCLLAPASALAQDRGPKVATENVTYRSGKDTVRAVVCRPDGKGPFPAVVAVHGDFGLTGWVKEQAQRLAAKGYVVLAIDLYRGSVAKDLEEAHILERGLDLGRVQTDIKAALDYLQTRPEVSKDRLGILGWDMGGGHALDAAMRDGRLKATVVCYGRLTTDSKPLAGLRGPVLGLFAGKDEGIPPETTQRFQAAMKKAGKRAAVHVYPDVGTCFLDPKSPYLSAPTPAAVITDAWARIEKFFAEELGR
ncbi:MAG: dienelactone hydrolase family protein [Gemmataceae bacterium]|nr:dienelactone hydrolase family protein [Gemmataceae bacterium]